MRAFGGGNPRKQIVEDRDIWRFWGFLPRKPIDLKGLWLHNQNSKAEFVVHPVESSTDQC